MKDLLIVLAILIILNKLQKKSFTIIKHKLAEIYSHDEILKIEKSNQSTTLISIVDGSYNKAKNFHKKNNTYRLMYIILGIIFFYFSLQIFNSIVNTILFITLILLLFYFFRELKVLGIRKLLFNESLKVKIHLLFFISYKYIALILYLLIVGVSLE